MSESHNPIPSKNMNRQKTWLTVFGIFCLVFGISLYFQWPLGQKNEPVIKTASEPWDKRLLACNEITTAEETEAFSTCLAAAEDGWPRAQMKIAWTYTRQGDFQNWNEAYKWVSIIGKSDRRAELLRYIMLLSLGESKKDKTFGEKGIKRLANVNYGPASAYLGALYKLEQNTLAKTSRAIWLFQRAYEQAPDLFSAFDLAAIYSNGFGVEQDYKKATSVLLKHADLRFPVTTNNVAWYLATLDQNPLLMPEKAVELAEKVTQNKKYSNNHIYIDTLAAAYAANGEYNEAITTQENALALLLKIVEAPENSALVAEYKERLSAYKNEERTVTESLVKEYDAFFKKIKLSIESALLRTLNRRIEAPELVDTELTNNSND